MKYTRYNISPKHKKENKFLFYLALTLLMALLLGTFLFKFVFQNSGKIGFLKGGESSQLEENLKNEATEQEQGSKNEVEQHSGEGSGEVAVSEYKFYLLQCGVFKVKENANGVISKLTPLGNPFIGQEGELSKVYFGIYSSENIDAGVAILNDKGIENTKVSINIPATDLSTTQYCKIIQSLLQIINKGSEGEVKSINTAELKKWTGTLDSISEDMDKYNEVNTLKEYINAFPDQVDKTQIESMTKYLYDEIIKFKKK